MPLYLVIKMATESTQRKVYRRLRLTANAFFNLKWLKNHFLFILLLLIWLLNFSWVNDLLLLYLIVAMFPQVLY